MPAASIGLDRFARDAVPQGETRRREVSRDVLVFETLEGLDTVSASVRDAMSDDVYVVAPDHSVRDVAWHMAENKLDVALVLDGARVAGIFTAVDGLRALSLLLKQVQQSLR